MPVYTEADIKRNGLVDVWDRGPDRPSPPDPPPPEPKKTGKAIDDALAMQEYEDAVSDYKAALRRYSAEKRDFDFHRLHIGGAIKLERWPILAEGMVTDWPNRYCKDLPPGVKVGHAHVEAEERRAEETKEQQRIRDRDPHMGKPQQQGAP